MQRQWLIIVLLLPLLTGGCATRALWNNNRLDAANEPASNADVRLYDASLKKDFLVVYDEYSERHDSVRARAYFLNQNQSRVEQRLEPHFVSAGLAHELPPVPVFQASPAAGTNFYPALYAIVSTNGQALTIFSAGRGTNYYELPVYNDGRGKVERIALTPVAVVADLTIIGGYVGVWLLYGMATTGYTTH